MGNRTPSDDGSSYSDSIKNFNVSRRKFAVTSGAFIPTLSTLPISASASSTTEILHRHDHQEPIYKTVPASWKEHLDHAREVKREYDEENLHESWITATGLTSADSPQGDFGDRNGFLIDVQYSDESVSTDDKIQEYEGIEIQYSYQEDEDDTLANETTNVSSVESTSSINPRLGGQQIKYANSQTQGGSIGACVRYGGVGGDPAIVMAQHVATDSDYCNENLSGATQESPQNETIGWVENYNDDDYLDALDVAIVEISQVRDVEAKIYNENGSDRDVVGWYDKDGVADLLETDPNIEMTGRVSGTISGTLLDMDQTGSVSCAHLKTEGVLVSIGQQGDSGAIVHTVDGNDDLRLVSMVSQSAGDNAKGASVYSIFDDANDTILWTVT